LAARYQIVAVLGQAQFSKAIQVLDLENNKYYCIKVIQNNKEEGSKDNFDQSIDEIKLLRYISANSNTD
jgi:serine/threonine protein kinase